MLPKSMFLCPVCSEGLFFTEQGLGCKNGHRFDRSAAGYVHLLPANKKHSKQPGDDKIMCSARNRFLSAGFYAPLCDMLSQLTAQYTQPDMRILDAGCGEGYYTSAVYQAACQKSEQVHLAGIDISKFALKYAAKRLPQAEFAVASSYHLPLKDNCVDLILNCFSPMATSEFRRVLKKGGHLLYVVPAPMHLWELKQVLYSTPYQNKRQTINYEGFELQDVQTVESTIQLTTPQQIQDLFAMTPYFYKTPKEGQQALEQLQQLTVQIAFDIHIFSRQ